MTLEQEEYWRRKFERARKKKRLQKDKKAGKQVAPRQEKLTDRQDFAFPDLAQVILQTRSVGEPARVQNERHYMLPAVKPKTFTLGPKEDLRD